MIVLANAVGAMQYGWDYQSLLFWHKACDLLCGLDNIVKIGYEVDFAPGFDDVAVFYKPFIFLSEGERVDAEFFQLKNHMTMNGSISVEKLMDPKFINATSQSILQKLEKARGNVLNYPKIDVKSPLFRFCTPWNVDPDDILAKLLSGNTGFFKTIKLFEGGPKSAMGKFREQLQEHLEIDDDDDLKDLLERFGIETVNQDSLMQQLSDKLSHAGLLSLDRSKKSNPYTEAARKISQQVRKTFNREQLVHFCKQEGLWIRHAHTEKLRENIHIKSFSQFTTSPASRILDLTEYFDHSSLGGRYLVEDQSWDNIAQNIKAKIPEHFHSGEKVCLYLDVHLSIAFGLGYCLSPKSGVDVSIKQKGEKGIQDLVFPDQISSIKTEDLWKCTVYNLEGKGTELGVAIGITHPVREDVLRFLDQSSLPIKRLQCFEIASGPNPNSMKDMEHCIQLSKSILEEVKKISDNEEYERIHLFWAAPVSFVFQLGRKSNALGYQWQLYEFTFDKDGKERTYIPSLSKKMFF